jgi:hypothetical protein
VEGKKSKQIIKDMFNLFVLVLISLDHRTLTGPMGRLTSAP